MRPRAHLNATARYRTRAHLAVARALCRIAEGKPIVPAQTPAQPAAQTAAQHASTLQPLRTAFALTTLRAADAGKQAALSNYAFFLRASAAPPTTLERLSPYAALRAARHARRHVPAYRELVRRSGWRDDTRLGAAERLRQLPETDKETYVKAFTTEQRCQGGRIPIVGTQIDESSGSSGTPYNWVRSARELREVHHELSQFVRYSCGRNVITLNGFSMGSWATGVNVGEAMRAIGIVKSTGPDVDKILDTLQFFGPRYPYILTGYPPFLKHLVDEGEARGFNWGDYRISALCGGEGLRDYLERRFLAVYSGYGASDLDIGVAGELPLTVWIRKQADENRALATALFGDDPRLPMLFNYNPLDYYVETNAARELIITINRVSVLSPRIRYNIHDTGGVIDWDRMLSILHDFRLDPLRAVRRRGRPVFRMPFLYLFGRSDSTMSYMGANIYPEDIEQALFAEREDARRLGAYSMELLDIGPAVPGEQRPCVHVEVVAGRVEDEALAARLRERVLRRLLENNRDFRAATSEDASAAEVIVQLHAPGTGPFAGNRGRIKQRHVITSTVTAEAPAAVPSRGSGGSGGV
jgi:phenylacetate-CoA ligase